MTETQATLVHHRTIFDGWWSATIGTYIALEGYYVLVGVPVISTAWVARKSRRVICIAMVVSECFICHMTCSNIAVDTSTARGTDCDE